MLNVAKIETALKLLAINKRYRFNSHQVAYLSGNNDVNEVYNYLTTRIPYVIELSYEVLCPKRMDSNGSYSTLESIPNKWIECRVCATEFIPDPKMVHIVFNFNVDFLKGIEEDVMEKKAIHPQMSLC